MTSCSMARCAAWFPNVAEQAVIVRMVIRQDGATLRAIGAVTGHGPKSVQRILERASR
jgi:hypothetical protein